MPFYSCSSWKDPVKLGLSGCFLGIGSLDLSKFCHGARNPLEVVLDSSIFWKNVFFHQNRGNGPKIGFFEFKEKLGH